MGTPGFFVSHDVEELRALINKVAAKKVSYSNADLCKYYMHKRIFGFCRSIKDYTI